MQKVSIKDARINLSKIVDEVNEGKTYIVTKYGKPKAVISPVEEGEKKMDEKLKALKAIEGMWKDRDFEYKREKSRYGNIFD